MSKHTEATDRMMTAHDLAKIEHRIRVHMELPQTDRMECGLAFRFDKDRRRMTSSVRDWADIEENDDVEIVAFENYFAEFVGLVDNDQKLTLVNSVVTQYAAEVFVYTDDALADIYSAEWSGSEWSVKPA